MANEMMPMQQQEQLLERIQALEAELEYWRTNESRPPVHLHNTINVYGHITQPITIRTTVHLYPRSRGGQHCWCQRAEPLDAMDEQDEQGGAAMIYDNPFHNGVVPAKAKRASSSQQRTRSNKRAREELASPPDGQQSTPPNIHQHNTLHQHHHHHLHSHHVGALVNNSNDASPADHHFNNDANDEEIQQPFKRARHELARKVKQESSSHHQHQHHSNARPSDGYDKW